jgi:hypothetical protein
VTFGPVEDRGDARAGGALRLAECRVHSCGSLALQFGAELSAPRVSGRDFVSEHLRAARSPGQMRVTAANARVQEAQQKHSLGLVDASKLDEARASLGEAQAMVEMFRQKLDIRQKFLAGAVDAIETDLSGLEVEATQRRAALAPQVELARGDEQRTAA